jgi:hypothetical protein
VIINIWNEIGNSNLNYDTRSANKILEKRKKEQEEIIDEKMTAT